ncbi:MAG: amidophosphoribosyltransferase [Spirochaetia bacterium]
MDSIKSDKLLHHCGVVGIFTKEKTNIPEQLFFPLFTLQHRGQESVGIAYEKEERIVAYKDLGMVSTVLSKYLAEKKESNVGIGHVRYSTQGASKIENAQPIVVSCNKGDIALAHNGNLSNADSIKRRLFSEGSIFQSTSDTELILHMISRSSRLNFYSALREVLQQLEGAFSMTAIHDSALYIIRDPWGFRPLYFGSKDGMYMAASETCAFDILRVTDYEEVKPGEIIKIDSSGVYREDYVIPKNKSQCIFELIYFARPDSEIFGTSVHLCRKKMGALLSKNDVEADFIMPVPDSGNSAALGYAAESGLPFEHGLTRSHYSGRSFIMPTEEQRELAVRIKLNPIKEVVRGKRIVLVDDSLVRGTTSRILVKLLREAGAKEIHLRLSAPELKWPCYFGIDIPTREELISNRKTPEEIAEFTKADSVRFLNVEELKQCVTNPEDYCYACFGGIYPLSVPSSNHTGAKK